jgi:hypothetical protein
VAGRVQIAESLRADARVPKQQAASGAADDVVVPAWRLVLTIADVQQRLKARAAAQQACGWDLDLRSAAAGIGDGGGVLGWSHHQRPADPCRPPQFKQPVGAGKSETPLRRSRQYAAYEPAGAILVGANRGPHRAAHPQHGARIERTAHGAVSDRLPAALKEPNHRASPVIAL